MWMTSALRAMFLWMATLVFRVVFKQVRHKVVRSITARDTDEQMLKNSFIVFLKQNHFSLKKVIKIKFATFLVDSFSVFLSFQKMYGF